ncbi:MAG TPA: hypothetical protein VF516_20190 [Kofleriaceae bacterium]
MAALCSCDSEREAVERVAEVEHAQWMAWSKEVAPEVSPARRARWMKYWVPYKDLPEEVKELDRVWARKAIEAARRR